MSGKNDPTEIQKLLRLKRFENPPEGYYEDFLLEFQRRQRAELLRVSVWQVAQDRFSLWLENFRVPVVAYAGIAAAALAVTTLVMSQSEEATTAEGSIASLSDPNARAWQLPTPLPATNREVTTLPPSYVLETRPVSYEAPLSF